MKTRTKLVISVMLSIFSVIQGCFGLYTAHAEVGDTLYVVVPTGEFLRGRSAPSYRSDVYLRFNRGDVVTEEETEPDKPGWVKVSTESDWAWVRSEYLSAEAPSEDDSGTLCTVQNANGRVRVRSKPGGSVIGYVRDGDCLRVTRWDSDDDGIMYAYADGVGWVMDKYVKEDASNE